MAVALKLTPNSKNNNLSKQSKNKTPVLAAVSTKAPGKVDHWGMTASEALRVNFVDKEIKFDRRIVDYLQEY